MSQAARNRASRRRKQPYAWLGVGAVTLGMGAAMVGGTAVAFADTGNASNDSAGASSTSEKAGNDAASTKSDAPAKRVTRGGAGVNSQQADDSASAPAHRGRAVVAPKSAVDEGISEVSASTPEVVSEAAPTPAPEVAPTQGNSPSPAAAATPARSHNSSPVVSAPTGTASAPVVDTAPAAPVVSPSADIAPSATPAAAASVPAAATSDPAPSDESWLPKTPIVPGAKVKLATEEIKQAQTLLTEETWGAGNVLAGLGSFGPASALATAQLALSIWGDRKSVV